MAFTYQEQRTFTGVETALTLVGSILVFAAGYGVLKTGLIAFMALMVLGLGLISFEVGWSVMIGAMALIVICNIFTAGIRYEREHPGVVKIEQSRK